MPLLNFLDYRLKPNSSHSNVQTLEKGEGVEVVFHTDPYLYFWELSVEVLLDEGGRWRILPFCLLYREMIHSEGLTRDLYLSTRPWSVSFAEGLELGSIDDTQILSHYREEVSRGAHQFKNGPSQLLARLLGEKLSNTEGGMFFEVLFALGIKDDDHFRAASEMVEWCKQKAGPYYAPRAEMLLDAMEVTPEEKAPWG